MFCLCTLIYFFVKSLLWLLDIHGSKLKPMAQNYLFIAISFYRNIVCKNILCVLGLKLIKIQTYSVCLHPPSVKNNFSETHLSSFFFMDANYYFVDRKMSSELCYYFLTSSKEKWQCFYFFSELEVQCHKLIKTW